MLFHRLNNVVISICLFILATGLTAEPDQKVPTKCPGLYCGRKGQDGNYSDCGACPRGSRADQNSLCRQCDQTPSFYDWLYLGFMALLSPALHWFFIDFTNHRKNGGILVLDSCALIETVVAVFCTMLAVEPQGSLSVVSCRVQRLSDWYPMFFNPSPDYTSTLHCTQEVVYPLYTMVMIYYAFGLVAMVLLRPVLSRKLLHQRGAKSIYAALYFFPILVLTQAVFAGIIYYSFPYIILVVSVITNAIHFAFFKEQSVRHLLKENFTKVRNLSILLCHWLLHAYGIIAITQLEDLAFHASLLCLVPFPAAFYLFTVKYTNPKNLE